MHNNSFKCHICGKILVRSRNLKHHIRYVHETVHLLKCKYFDCAFGTKHKEEMREHTLQHTDEEPNKCHLCKVTFLRPKTFKEHIRNIQLNGACPQTRKRHIKDEYTNGDPYKCHSCQFTFSSPRNLKRHIGRIQANGDCRKTQKRYIKDEHPKASLTNVICARSVFQVQGF